MKKRLIAVLAALGLVLGSGAVAVIVSSPDISLAQDSTDEAPDDDAEGERDRHRPFGDWAGEALAPLVTDGVITQGQADAVVEALEDAKPERRHRGGPGGFGPLADVAGLLGFDDPSELMAALAEGQTIAEIAAANNVDVQGVIDALVAEHTEKLERAVEDGRLTQQEADERLAEATERVNDLVNGEVEFRGRGFGRGFGRSPGGFGDFGSDGAPSDASF